jgi:hypothetical protein
MIRSFRTCYREHVYYDARKQRHIRGTFALTESGNAKAMTKLLSIERTNS